MDSVCFPSNTLPLIIGLLTTLSGVIGLLYRAERATNRELIDLLRRNTDTTDKALDDRAARPRR